MTKHTHDDIKLLICLQKSFSSYHSPLKKERNIMLFKNVQGTLLTFDPGYLRFYECFVESLENDISELGSSSYWNNIRSFQRWYLINGAIDNFFY